MSADHEVKPEELYGQDGNCLPGQPPNTDPFNLIFNIRTNETFQLQWLLTDQTGAKLNLTGYLVFMQIRSAASSTGTLLYSASIALGQFSLGTDPTQGAISLSIPAVDSAEFTWAKGYFDLVISVGGVQKVVASGVFNTIQGITSPGSTS